MAHDIPSTFPSNQTSTTLYDAEESIYFDFQATTPLDARVRQAMGPFLGREFGNPHSVLNERGKAARQAVELSRDALGIACGARGENMIFTSGATESNNIAILGFARANQRRGRHVLVSAIEHQSVLRSAMALRGEGFDVSLIPVGADGVVSPDAVKQCMRSDTILVSAMAVNNEIGTVQPIKEIGALCRERGAAYHCDASQAIGNIPLDLADLPIDYASISSHKMYGPPGIGAMYIAQPATPRLAPLFYGGSQERGLRPGTLPVALCVGLGYASTIAVEEFVLSSARIANLRGRMIDLLTDIQGFFLNGHPTKRVPNNLNFGFSGVTSQALVQALPELQFSTISACSAGAGGVSHVLQAIGCSDATMRCSVRIGLGRTTTLDQVETASAKIAGAVDYIRRRRA